MTEPERAALLHARLALIHVKSMFKQAAQVFEERGTGLEAGWPEHNLQIFYEADPVFEEMLTQVRGFEETIIEFDANARRRKPKGKKPAKRAVTPNRKKERT